MNQSWYNNSENEKDSWYAPPARDEEEPAPERPSRFGWVKPLISVLLVIALIAGSSAAFGSKKSSSRRNAAGAGTRAGIPGRRDGERRDGER